MAGNTQIFRAALHKQRSVYRDIEIEGASSLHDLAEAILGAFDFFDLDHAFGFYSGANPDTMRKQQPKYELFADMGEKTDAKSVKETKVAEAFARVGQAMILLFDYDSQWLFHVEMAGKGAKAAHLRYPRMVGTKGEAPDQYPDPDD